VSLDGIEQLERRSEALGVVRSAPVHDVEVLSGDANDRRSRLSGGQLRDLLTRT
jgi:hypothetical protein